MHPSQSLIISTASTTKASLTYQQQQLNNVTDARSRLALKNQYMEEYETTRFELKIQLDLRFPFSTIMFFPSFLIWFWYSVTFAALFLKPFGPATFIYFTHSFSSAWQPLYPYLLSSFLILSLLLAYHTPQAFVQTFTILHHVYSQIQPLASHS